MEGEEGVKRCLDITDTKNSEKKVKVSLDLPDENGGEMIEEKGIHYGLLSNSYDVDLAKNKTISMVKEHDADQNHVAESDSESNDDEPSLLDLNDHCLYKIFLCLCIYDLTNIANTCVRFRNWAQYVFESHHKFYINFDWRPNGCIKDNEVKEAIRIFGPHTKEIAINMNIFNQLFSSESSLSQLNKYCNSLDNITLNNLKFTKWVPQRPFKMLWDDSSDDDWCSDSDEDREWRTGDVSPKFLTNLPKVKTVIINKGTLFCGCALFDNWKNEIEKIVIKDVLIGDGFLKALRNLYNEKRMTGHDEVRSGRDNRGYRNFRIVEATFTPKTENDKNVKIE